MSLKDDIQTAIDAMDVVAQDLANAEPTFADQLLAAVQPVFETAGWAAPTAETTTTPELPATE